MPSSTRSTRRELAQCAPSFPSELPPALRGKPLPLTKIVEPLVETRVRDDEEFRNAAASFNAENSPNKKVCFDDKDMADKIKADGDKAGIQRIIDAALGDLSTAIKRVMTKRGVGRMQRLKAAQDLLLSNSAQPAE